MSRTEAAGLGSDLGHAVVAEAVDQRRVHGVHHPAEREKPGHHTRANDAVRRPPRSGPVAEQPKFQRQPVCTLLNARVDAVGVGLKDQTPFVGQILQHGSGHVTEVQDDEKAVVTCGFFAQHLGQAAQTEASKEIELPEAILGEDVAESEKQIVLRGSGNVRHTQLVAGDFDGAADLAEPDLAGHLRLGNTKEKTTDGPHSNN